MPQSTTYDIVGKKEDVSAIISNISPTKYPFTTMTGSDTCKATLFQWQEDALRDPTTNKQLEGFTAAPTARTATVIRNNVTQIMQDTFQIAATTDAVSTYGRAKESAYQASLAAEALKKDYEFACVGTGQAKVSPADNTTARQFAGYQAQIDAGVQVLTGGAGTKVTETNLLDLMETLYKNGADPSVIMVTPKRSRDVAAFAAASGRARQIPNGGKDRAIINVVDLYVSPFGEQKVILNRNLKQATDGTAADTLVFDPDNWVKVTLQGRGWTRETLAKTGDNTSMMIVGEFSLRHKNFKASGYVREG